MRIPTLKALVASAVLGAVLAPAVSSADEPGVVRISDGVRQTALLEPESVPPPEPLSEEAAAESAPLESLPPNSTIVYDEHGRRIYGNSYQGEYRPRKFFSPAGVWLSNDPYACTLPPDYGFVPPSGMPFIERAPVEYTRYWPNQWYGTPGMNYSQEQFPMVYMPTDTTQLGYTYQYVPRWRPNPNMLPPAPNVEEWQRRSCPPDANGNLSPETSPFSGKYREKHKGKDKHKNKDKYKYSGQ